VTLTPGAGHGVDTMTGPLRCVAMRAPGAILAADHERWHYAKPLDPDALGHQYRTFAELVAASGAEIVWLPDGDDDLADSIFTYDPSIMTPAGAIVLRPGKPLRSGEAELHRSFYRAHDIPIIGTITAPGTVEGGDCLWLDPATLAVGRGFRTNQAGIDQLVAIVESIHIEVTPYDLPYFRGPDACLHLMSVVNPLDTDLALVHAELMPIALHQVMVDMGYDLLHAPTDELEASAGLSVNVLATGPRRGIAVDGFPRTVDLMRSAGCDVTVFRADELCIPCEGGPTCLTRPLLRDPGRR